MGDRDPTANIQLDAAVDAGGATGVKAASKNAANKAKQMISNTSSAVISAMGYDATDDEPDPKDYKLEPDEVNELFRATSTQRGGLGLQLCIFMTVVFFILVDTVTVSGIQGTIGAVHYLTETAYWQQQHRTGATVENDKDELIFTTSRTLSPESKDELRDFYTSSKIGFRNPEVTTLDDEYVFGMERSGRVLRFIKDSDDYEKWLKFVLTSIWGPKTIIDENFSLYNMPDDELILKYKSDSMCPDIPPSMQDSLTYSHAGHFNMDSNYIMGARLVVSNANMQDIAGNSHFKQIYSQTRTHLKSVVKEGSKTHFDGTAWEGITHSGTEDDEYVAFFNGHFDKAKEGEPELSEQERCKKIEQVYQALLDNNVVSDKILDIKLELMTFSLNSRQGSIIRFHTHQNHAGQYRSYVTLHPFQPQNNGVNGDETFIRASLQFSYLVCIIWVLVESVGNLRKKCRQLFTYRLNEFSLQDIIQYILLFVGIIILVNGGILFWSPTFDYNVHFKLPLEDYEEYVIWVESAQLIEQFRALLGCFIMMQMINLLLTVSVILPSLGILFRTIEKSMNDMFVFTTITLLIFLVFVITVNVSFGEQIYQFSSLTESFLTCFEMFLGDIYYGRMYEADPTVSALILVLFVLIMNFMVLNMYTAIVIRTYNKLQARQLFLGESMARIQAKKAKRKINNCINLLRCRSPFNQPVDDQAGKRNEPDDEDKGNNQKLSQIFIQNFLKVVRNKVMTKEKFTRALETAAHDVAREKHTMKKDRMKQIKNTNVTASYAKLKKGIMLFLHLILVFYFYLAWTEASVHADIRHSIQDYLLEVKDVNGNNMNLNNIQATLLEPLQTINSYDFNHIGSNRGVIDKKSNSGTLRMTYRLNGLEKNLDPNSDKVFETVKQSKYEIASTAEKSQTSIFTALKNILMYFSDGELENTVSSENLVFENNQQETTSDLSDTNHTQPYRPPFTGKFDSFFDEGGFVYEFDTEEDRILKTSKGATAPDVEITLDTFIKQVTESQLSRELASLGVDWAMYNPHTDFFIYVGVLFKYSSGGHLGSHLIVQTFRSKPTQNQLIFFGLFVIFYLYYLIKLLIELAETFKQNRLRRDAMNGVQANPRLAEENERPWYLRLANFIGIDDQRLQGQNVLVVLVLVIWMVLKKIVMTAWYMVQAIYYYCTEELLNFIEFLNTVILTIILFSFSQFLPVLMNEEFQADEKMLQSINRISTQQLDASSLMAYSVFCMCIRVLQLPSFSLIANLPFETLSQGRKDIINILVILLIFIVSSSLACYVVFCSQLEEFSHFVRAMYQTNKIYMGDFSIIGKMFATSPKFTTFYLFMSMVLYTMFIAQMLLGVVVGHFQTEWTRVQKIIKESNGQSFQILPVIGRVIKDYFRHRHDQELRELRRKGIDPESPQNRRCCPFNCSCKSLNPSGMFERIVIYLMMNWCRKKKDQIGASSQRDKVDKQDQESERSALSSSDDSDDGEAVQDNKRQQSATTFQTKLPFNKEELLWGMPGNLKSVEDFKLFTGAQSYMKVFDGWSIDKYKLDWDTFEYQDLRKKIKKGPGGSGDIDKKLDQTNTAAMLKQLPTDVNFILDLEKFWNDVVDEYEKANSNYWMYHLAKQVLMLTKKEISLSGLKAMDSYFTQHLVTKAQEQSTSLQDQLSKEQVKIFFMSTSERDKFFADPNQSVDEKYLAWKAIDLVHRYNMQKSAFDEAAEEKKNHENGAKEAHNNLMTLLIAQIERPIEEDVEKSLFNFSIVNKIAENGPGKNNGKNPLKFEAIKAAAWRKKKFHRVFHYLQKVWRDLLTDHEKYELWFNYFNTMERVRLWNQLVFSREWFRRVVQFSRKQVNYRKAVVKVEKIQKDQAKQAGQQKNKKPKDDEENPDDDQALGNNKDPEEKFYRGFHRRDLNDILKEHARKMYKRGVRNAELLIIKIKPELEKDIIDRQHIGGTTSFFNNDLVGEEKKKSELIQKIIEKDSVQEMKETRRIFTPDKMLTMWNQFLSGTFMLLSEKKTATNVDAEDGIYNEYKILRLEDEEKYLELQPLAVGRSPKMKPAAFKQYWLDQKQFQQKRTMDRYEQIHFFFSSIIEHNIKTLESCEASIREMKDKAATAKADALANQVPVKSILKNGEKNLEKSKVGGLKKDSKKNSAADDTKKPSTGADKGEKEGEPFGSVGSDNKYQLYESVRNLVIEEEERLPLWMLMSKEEKLDMLAHECIDSEAQIMGLLIEFEYGAEAYFKKEGTNLSVDSMLEQALDQMIFQKYLAYTRLQATFYARKFTSELITQTQDQSIKLYVYAEYLSDMEKTLRKSERKNNKQIEANKIENAKIEGLLRNIAQTVIMDQNFSMRTFDDEQKDRVALTMKFLFEVKDDK